jgi:hypothetical protein
MILRVFTVFWCFILLTDRVYTLWRLWKINDRENCAVKGNESLLSLSELAPEASYTPLALEKDASLQTYICVDFTNHRFYMSCSIFRE